MKSTENPWKSHEIFTRFPRKKWLPPARLHPQGLPAGSSRSVNKKWPRKSTSKFISLGPKNHLKQVVFFFKNLQFIHFLHLCLYFFSLIRAVCSFTRIYLHIYLLYMYIYIYIYICEYCSLSVDCWFTLFIFKKNEAHEPECSHVC